MNLRELFEQVSKIYLECPDSPNDVRVEYDYADTAFYSEGIHLITDNDPKRVLLIVTDLMKEW